MSDVTVKAVIIARSLGLGINCCNALNGSHSGVETTASQPHHHRARPSSSLTRAIRSVPTNDGTLSSKTNMAVRGTCRGVQRRLVLGPDRRAGADLNGRFTARPAGVRRDTTATAAL
jgi:hypothetical protein